MAGETYTFPYEFTDSTLGIDFDVIQYPIVGDIRITVGKFDIYGWCVRYDIDNFKAIIETFVNKDNYLRIKENIVPGAAGELFNILGSPFFYDMTWEGYNTITITPNKYTSQNDYGDYSGDNSSTLIKMRSPLTLYVSNIAEHKISKDLIGIQLEGYISGSII